MWGTSAPSSREHGWSHMSSLSQVLLFLPTHVFLVEEGGVEILSNFWESWGIVRRKGSTKRLKV